MPHNEPHPSYEACGTNQRKLMMWRVDAGGHKLDVHRWKESCAGAGCVPLTRDELISYSRLDKQTVDRVQVLLGFENMERVPKT